MKKLGRLIHEEVAPKPFYHQLCLAHSIHLAMRDVLEIGRRREDLETEEARLIDKVRELMKLLRRPKMASKLLRAGCKLKAILDVDTRWNSIVKMLERFLQIRPYLRSLFTERRREYGLKKAQKEKIEELIAALTPIKTASEAVSRERSNLLDADKAFEIISPSTTMLISHIDRGDRVACEHLMPRSQHSTAFFVRCNRCVSHSGAGP